MTIEQTKKYLDTLPLVQALWWYIENMVPDDHRSSALFFHLRERVRTET